MDIPFYVPTTDSLMISILTHCLQLEMEHLNLLYLCILKPYVLLFQKSRPDRYVALFGEFQYDPSKWRPSVAFVEQLRGFQELIDEGKVSNNFQINWIFSLEACN